MTETMPAYQVPVVKDQVKIAYQDLARKTVRLVFMTGLDKGQNLEYDYKNADVDARIRTGDAPIDATTQGGKLLSLKFPAGMEPPPGKPTPAKLAEQPVMKPAESKPEESIKVNKPAPEQKPTNLPAVQQPKQPEQKPAGQPFNMKGYLRKKQLDPAKDFHGFSLERIKDGKPSGDAKFYDFADLENRDTLIESLKTLQEGQQVDYVQMNYLPVKIGPAGSLNQGWKGGNKFGGGPRTDPVIDLIRNLSILNESILDKSEKWVEFCILNGVTLEEREQGWNWIKGTTIKTALEIYQEIEKKHQYGGQI